MRVGLGYDIHRTALGRPLVLGGIHIPAEFGLDGHSDADVIVHAIMDAVLGAASLGDIGQHFPPTDDEWRNISSLELLQRVRALARNSGYRVVNVDAVLVAEQPLIAPYRNRMREAIAGALGVDASSVGLKATTNEGTGPEGRGEAMSAQAVALLDAGT